MDFRAYIAHLVFSLLSPEFFVWQYKEEKKKKQQQILN